MKLIIEQSGNPGTRYEVWPRSNVPSGFVQEARDFIIELVDCDAAETAELLFDDVPIEALRSRTPRSARWRWNPGFYAGRASFAIKGIAAGDVKVELVTDPDLAKLTREDFDAMVRDILSDTNALFALSPFRTGVAKGDGASSTPPLARLEFIRSRIKELESVAEKINARPVRTLEPTEEVVPYHRARPVTPHELRRSMRSGNLHALQSPLRLPRTQIAALPERVRKSQKIVTLDTPEHRAMKSFLLFLREWLLVVSARLGRDRSGDLEMKQRRIVWTQRCADLAGRVGRILTLPVFAQAESKSQPTIPTTPVFRRVESYRAFFGIYSDLRLGIARVVGDFLHVPLARTFDLYELWCFLRLIRALLLKFGSAGIDVTSLFSVDSGGNLIIMKTAPEVTLGAIRIAFKRSYREYWNEAEGIGSFSRTMVPDISSRSGTGPATALIIFDAKYRIDTQLNDAIASLHMYRDALLNGTDEEKLTNVVAGAFLLTPHTHESVDDWKKERIPGLLFHPEYNAKFRFGAVTMRPSMSLEDIGSAILLALKHAGVAHSQTESRVNQS